LPLNLQATYTPQEKKQISTVCHSIYRQPILPRRSSNSALFATQPTGNQYSPGEAANQHHFATQATGNQYFTGKAVSKNHFFTHLKDNQ
jgi:hypothetical protein